MRKLFLLVILFFYIDIAKADNISSNVMLNIERKSQENSEGYNVMDELCTQVYRAVLNGEIPLYEDNSKKYKIKVSSLLNFERKTHYSFSSTNEIWLYEQWNKESNGKTKIETKGMAFIRTNPNRDVLFGYVDINEAEKVLKRYVPQCNAFGYCNLNLLQIVKDKKFRYSVVMIDGKEVHSESRSESYKNKFIETATSISADSTSRLKEVTYGINFNEKSNLIDANTFIKSVEKYLRENPQILLNSGASNLLNYLDEKELENISVSRITITELWGISKSEFYYLPQNFTVTLNGLITLNPIPFKELYNWNLDVTFEFINKLINDKYFNYSITKINNQQIKEEDDNGLKAIRNLYAKNW